jgi:hypothetical protein
MTDSHVYGDLSLVAVLPFLREAWQVVPGCARSLVSELRNAVEMVYLSSSAVD